MSIKPKGEMSFPCFFPFWKDQPCEIFIETSALISLQLLNFRIFNILEGGHQKMSAMPTYSLLLFEFLAAAA